MADIEKTGPIFYFAGKVADFKTPKGATKGSKLYVSDSSSWYVFDGSDWVEVDALETSVTIDVSASTTISTAFNKGQCNLIALSLPAEFTGTSISFQTCLTATGTYAALYYPSGLAVSATVAQGTNVTLSDEVMTALAPWQHIKIVSGTEELDDRTITIRCVKV
jgi:hypothetical protein